MSDSVRLGVSVAAHFTIHLVAKIVSGALGWNAPGKEQPEEGNTSLTQTWSAATAANRAHNALAQLVYCSWHLYLLFVDVDVTADKILGYSSVAHRVYLGVAGFYIYDTIFMWWVPLSKRTPSERRAGLLDGRLAGWTAHHVITLGLLYFITQVFRQGAFTASVFMVSAAGHIPNEVRWFVNRGHELQGAVPSRYVVDGLNLVSLLVIFGSSNLIPVWMIPTMGEQLRGADARDMSLWANFTTGLRSMRGSCVVGWLGIFLPHVAILASQWSRTRREWGGRRARQALKAE